jgi:ABC-type protease/lipase transport system fused ATPase/permease subunit
VTGPVGAGKSTLAKALIGLRRPVSGSVRLGGIEAFNLDPSIRSAWIGYLPQHPELLPGTIAENIARYGERNMEAVQEAGMLAGIHEVILSLPLGYDTTVNAESPFLSGGQRQLVGLARAIYGKPHYIVLDEPSSMIDRTASDRIGQILGQLKARGAIVVLISHRRSLLLRSDAVMLMEAGRIVDMKRPNQQKQLAPAKPPALTREPS